ncbi:MAG: ATP/cobalamin adenosyltransferase [Candidatus Berkelbacteria bacterium Licking1014_85]|uniref:Corrinoid adenosyltransferase n=1 Tax=Candidatus Berkelbacteria bacterium Licking1014_85 TaxID=2017148 RepID=A0A554LMX6_9BACT|nr:MAG: ATP/cobalamin adenosyltransferase [Candidatus Berkelbacteria bacterium Licking1014_85]
MSIYTKFGDDGYSKINHKQLKKNDAVFEVIGDIDELNCQLGLAKARSTKHEIRKKIENIQNNIMQLMSEIALYNKIENFKLIENWKMKIGNLENNIDSHSTNIPPKFIIPAKSELSALIHIARTICRRAERHHAKLKYKNKFHSAFLNRLSDFLFVLAENC